MNAPNGYRFLNANELIMKGDYCLIANKHDIAHDLRSYNDCDSSVGNTPFQYELESISKPFTVIRKIKNMSIPTPNKILTITEDKVLEAAAKCSEAEKILKIIFPDVFKSKIVLPKPGQRWKHRDYDDIYTRIDDKQGAKILGRDKPYPSEFYSVDSTGYIRFTNTNSTNIILLDI